MPIDPVSVLQELAKRFGGRLSACEVYDANVCTTRSAPERPWELILVSGEPFLKRLRFVYRARKVTLLANRTYVSGTIEGTFGARPFTLNAKQKAGFRSEYADSLFVAGNRYPIFTEDGYISSEQKNLLCRPELASLVEQGNMRDGESLNFNKGGLGFYLMQPEPDRVIGVVDRIINLADKIPVDEVKLNLKLLPAQFHPLIPLIQKWAVDDDSVRDDLLSSASHQALQLLIEEVEPYLQAIDSYLESFREGSPTQEAAALGRLAECALEARRYLNDNGRLSGP